MNFPMRPHLPAAALALAFALPQVQAQTALSIPAIQGSGSTSPYATSLVTTTGVVTKINSNGFFIQDLTGDGNPATSDGLFVFASPTTWSAAVAVGNLVSVTGTVTEFNTGAAANSDTASHTLTELTGVTAVTLVGTGYSITPVTMSLPEAVNDDLERHEGMLVTITGPLTVAQNYFQARYGQLTLSAGGRLETPTNRHRPGTPEAIALADRNARARILLDDGSTAQNRNPTPYIGSSGAPRGGDTIGSITGVIDYGLATAGSAGFGDYKIHPTTVPVFSSSHPRPAAPAGVGGNLKVASFNVLNYFTTFTNGQTADGLSGQGCSLDGTVATSNCRGATSSAEFIRQRNKIVEAMLLLDADVLGLMEIQNNGNTAVDNLVEALNTRLGAGTYASVGLPAAGTGSDAIRVAMIYKPSRVARSGAALSDTDAVNNRPTLAQTFQMANGVNFSVLVNHLKSKGSCPSAGDANAAGNTDAGDGQGCWNGLRTQQAQRLRTFASQVQTAAGSSDLLIIGDLNAYGQEDPVHALTSYGWVDEAHRFAPASGFAYSYVFDGAAGRLDHLLSSSTLSAKVSGATHWHINADESVAQDYNLEFKQPACGTCAPDPYSVSPYRSSDHDPALIGLYLYNSYITATGATVTGTAGDDLITAGAGRRTLTGGGGRDQFAFTSSFAGGGTIADFTPGSDVINLRAILQALRVSAAAPFTQGYITCTHSGSSDAVIGVDPDASGPAARRQLILLKNLRCDALDSSSFLN